MAVYFQYEFVSPQHLHMHFSQVRAQANWLPQVPKHPIATNTPEHILSRTTTMLDWYCSHCFLVCHEHAAPPRQLTSHISGRQVSHCKIRGQLPPSAFISFLMPSIKEQGDSNALWNAGRASRRRTEQEVTMGRLLWAV